MASSASGNFSMPMPEGGSNMIWTMTITALCTAGTGFYLRFLVAMCRECRLVSAGHWMLLRVHAPRKPIATAEPQRTPIVRAA
jgi:hypothetical protein